VVRDDTVRESEECLGGDSYRRGTVAGVDETGRSDERSATEANDGGTWSLGESERAGILIEQMIAVITLYISDTKSFDVTHTAVVTRSEY